MVRVVPAFPQPKDAKEGVVATLVVAVKGLTTPNVADRVDAPSNVMNEQNSNESAPDESSPCPAGRPNEQPSDCSWDEQAGQHPQWK